MAHPAVIRTEFASAEDVAEAYGLPESRVKALQKVLIGRKQQTVIRKRDEALSMKMASRGKKRLARKK